MINFKKILKDCLLLEEPEGQSTNPPPQNPPQNPPQTNTQQLTNSFEDLFGAEGFLSNAEIKPEVEKFQAAYRKKYGADLSNKDISTTARLCKDPWTSKSAQSFLEKGSLFPVIDLIFYIAEEIARAQGKPSEHSKDIFASDYPDNVKTIKTALQKANSKFEENAITSNPIDYQPLSTDRGPYIKVQILKHLYKTEEVSKVFLTNYKGSSIKEAVYWMLAARKKVRAKTIPGGTVPDQGKEVWELMINYTKFAGGIDKFSAKLSSDKVYTQPVWKDLWDIARKADLFYQSEQESAQEVTESLRFFNKNLLNEDSATDAANAAAEAGKATEQTQQQNPEEKQTENKPQYQFLPQFPDFLENKRISDNSKKFQFTTTDKKFLTPPSQQAFDGGYTIENIETMAKNNVPGAKQLYDKLTSFANYIREGELVDWMKVAEGAKSIAQGLSLGVPTRGKR